MVQVKGICKVILFTFVPGVIVGLLAFVISYFLPVIVVELGRDFYLGDRILGAEEARDAGRQLFGFTGLCPIISTPKVKIRRPSYTCSVRRPGGSEKGTRKPQEGL